MCTELGKLKKSVVKLLMNKNYSLFSLSLSVSLSLPPSFCTQWHYCYLNSSHSCCLFSLIHYFIIITVLIWAVFLRVFLCNIVIWTLHCSSCIWTIFFIIIITKNKSPLLSGFASDFKIIISLFFSPPPPPPPDIIIFFIITPVVNVVTIVLCVAYWHID